MDSHSLNSVIAKIHKAGCCDELELADLQMTAAQWDALLYLDQIDRHWQTEIKNHVCRLVKFGKRHLPDTTYSIFCAVGGSVLACRGIYIFYQLSQGTAPRHLSASFAYSHLAIAGLLMVLAFINYWNNRRFQPVLKAYEAARKPALAKLPKDQRPGVRFCLECMEFTEEPATQYSAAEPLDASAFYPTQDCLESRFLKISSYLSDKEIHVLECFTAFLEPRLMIHLMDNDWAEDIQCHMLHFKHHGGKSSQLPTRTLYWLHFLVAGGTFWFVWSWKDLAFLNSDEQPLVFRILIVAFGLFFFYRGMTLMRTWDSFRKRRDSYHSARRALLERLPQELQPAERVCLKCARFIT